MKKLISFCILNCLLIMGSPAFSWEPYDRIVAVVNDLSIIESDVDNKFNQLTKLKNVPKNRYSFEKSRILDRFIEDALISETAMQEAIVVNNKRVLLHIQDIMKHYFATKIQDKQKADRLIVKLIDRLDKKLADESVIIQDKEVDEQLDAFIQFLEAKNQLPFRDFFEEIRSQLIREQIMSYAIGVTPPTKEESMDWYKKNKTKLGDEVWFKQILIRPTGNSFLAERDAHKKLSDIRTRIAAGESFEKLAATYSQDGETAAKGGDAGWKMLIDLDPYLAGFVSNLQATGQLSQVFKSGIGYHVIKLIAKRPLTYEKVERLILNKLYNENMFHQFKKWVIKKKKESEILIFMKNYASEV
jgi:putative peptidyl-prolyl cis-trans isomerase